MLNKAIEIEGLIRILKDGEPSAESAALLRVKISELKELAELFQIAPTYSESPDPKASLSETSTEDNAGDLVEVSLQGPDDILLFSEEEDDAPHPSAPLRPSGTTDLKKYFSLNDRYLYSRELFGGDMKMFDSTLRFLEGVKDFSDIEDYFYSELEWDPEDPNVASFLDILRPHFNE